MTSDDFSKANHNIPPAGFELLWDIELARKDIALIVLKMRMARSRSERLLVYGLALIFARWRLRRLVARAERKAMR